MSIFVDKNTRLLVQGITGKEGQFHTRQCIAYGTNVVAGVTPGKGGQKLDDVPVFNSVQEAVDSVAPNCSMIFVPPPYAGDAIMEAADAGIPLIVTITEGIPVHDMMRARSYLAKTKSQLIGPNCPGIITPGQCKVSIISGNITMPGPIGITTRSGTLTYEVVHQLTMRGIGQSTCLGIGGDLVRGLGFIECLDAFEKDPETRGMVIVGEIGGDEEEKAADFIAKNVTKPVVGFIAGLHAPQGRAMGHAGAIIDGSTGQGQSKIAAMKASGIHICENLATIGELCTEVYKDCLN